MLLQGGRFFLVYITMLVKGSGEITQEDLREFLHDLNGEIFLIRGFLDLHARSLDAGTEQALLIGRMNERLDALQEIVKGCHGKAFGVSAAIPSCAIEQ